MWQKQEAMTMQVLPAKTRLRAPLLLQKNAHPTGKANKPLSFFYEPKKQMTHLKKRVIFYGSFYISVSAL